MAILFDWYENPKTKDKQDEELTLHPRIRLNGSTGTAQLRRFIQEYCSLTETDVSAVLDALSHFMGRELGEGRQVHLDGIGYFRPTLHRTGEGGYQTEKYQGETEKYHFPPRYRTAERDRQHKSPAVKTTECVAKETDLGRD